MFNRSFADAMSLLYEYMTQGIDETFLPLESRKEERKQEKNEDEPLSSYSYVSKEIWHDGELVEKLEKEMKNGEVTKDTHVSKRLEDKREKKALPAKEAKEKPSSKGDDKDSMLSFYKELYDDGQEQIFELEKNLRNAREENARKVKEYEDLVEENKRMREKMKKIESLFKQT